MLEACVNDSTQEFPVGDDENALRADQLLAKRFPEASRAAIKELFEKAFVRLDGQRIKKGAKVFAGQMLSLEQTPSPRDFVPQADASLILEVVYEDAELLVVNKPAGIPCHPLRQEEVGTLIQGALAIDAKLADVRGYAQRELGLLHRLDNETSGVVVIARTTLAFQKWSKILRADKCAKTYLAWCNGYLREQLVRLPLENGRKVKVADEEFGQGEPAETDIIEVEMHDEWARAVVEVRAAKRHQIRAHLAALGAPILGDELYGTRGKQTRHLLHAWKIELPDIGVLEASVPADMQRDNLS